MNKFDIIRKKNRERSNDIMMMNEYRYKKMLKASNKFIKKLGLKNDKRYEKNNMYTLHEYIMDIFYENIDEYLDKMVVKYNHDNEETKKILDHYNKNRGKN